MGILENALALITTQGRSIGTIIPDCAIEEHHLDELIITDHPVETGATVSDHAFSKPAEVVMKIGFSNSTVGSVGYVQSVYQELLALQASRVPFNVSTGKRQYTNMLMSAIEVVTDATSEFALMVTAHLRFLNLVSTQQSGSVSGIGATGDQASPQDTQPVQDAGTTSLSGYSVSYYDPASASGIGTIGGSSPNLPAQAYFNAGPNELSNDGNPPFAPFDSGTGTLTGSIAQ